MVSLVGHLASAWKCVGSSDAMQYEMLGQPGGGVSIQVCSTAENSRPFPVSMSNQHFRSSISQKRQASISAVSQKPW